MCGDMLPRASNGGLIAVMRSPRSSSSSSSASSSSSSSFSSSESQNINEFRIFLNNNRDRSGSTQATFDVSDSETLLALKSQPFLSLQIEKSGDLSMSTQSEPLHSFTLRAAEKDGLQFELPSKLDLGVSSIGVVGRLITVVSGGDSHQSRHIIGRGILGWN